MLKELYTDLYHHYGNLNYWPTDTADEKVIGCILTQNTAWSNVEKSIANLKSHNINTINDIMKINIDELKELIKSSGFYNQKSAYLKNISSAIINNYGSLDKMKKLDIESTEKFMLNIKGVGQETMEAIMLYALDYPVFTVDNYTFRFFKRYYNIEFSRAEIHKMAEFEFSSVEQLKNFHGMITLLSKEICKKTPKCSICFLRNKCIFGTKI
ncbi:MAG: endonuclease III domain-containing protein [Ferroplasma sp.]